MCLLESLLARRSSAASSSKFFFALWAIAASLVLVSPAQATGGSSGGGGPSGGCDCNTPDPLTMTGYPESDSKTYPKVGENIMYYFWPKTLTLVARDCMTGSKEIAYDGSEKSKRAKASDNDYFSTAFIKEIYSCDWWPGFGAYWRLSERTVLLTYVEGFSYTADGNVFYVGNAKYYQNDKFDGSGFTKTLSYVESTAAVVGGGEKNKTATYGYHFKNDNPEKRYEQTLTQRHKTFESNNTTTATLIDVSCLIDDPDLYLQADYAHGEDPAYMLGTSIYNWQENYQSTGGFAVLLTLDSLNQRPLSWNGPYGSIILYSPLYPVWRYIVKRSFDDCQSRVAQNL